MEKSKEITELADKIVAKLKATGFVIQRYDSRTTNSVYLKLDYGVCNSIRISDHKGKEHLQYRYNLLATITHVKKDKTSQGWDRWYFSFKEVDVLIDLIKRDRKKKLKQYGDRRYHQFMEDNKEKNNNSKGFWSQCELV